MRLDTHVVVVTGAARGIGRAIAEQVVREGAGAVLVDLDPAVEVVAKELGAVPVVGDIVDVPVAEHALMEARKLGPVTGLVNNAAVVPPREKLLNMRDQTWERCLAVNVEAPMRWCRTFLPAMLERKAGSIVNIATLEANVVGPAGLAYHVSKAALLALTRSVAVEYGREGVRCNSVSPGSTRTPTAMEVYAAHPGLEETLVAMNYAGRLGEPAEIASMVVYLLSDESGYCNGADYVIDGGRLAASLGPGGALE